MSLHIIIDGYNLILQSKTFSEFNASDIESARDALVDALAGYKRLKAHKITVVFDGGNALNDFSKKDQRKGIHIRFSSNRETADHVIKRMAAKEREKALVVSSDKEIVNYAESKGSATISSPLFEERIHLAASYTTDDTDPEIHSGWVPTTKKKGPARRLSKRQRRNRIKLNKL